MVSDGIRWQALARTARETVGILSCVINALGFVKVRIVGFSLPPGFRLGTASPILI